MRTCAAPPVGWAASVRDLSSRTALTSTVPLASVHAPRLAVAMTVPLKDASPSTAAAPKVSVASVPRVSLSPVKSSVAPSVAPRVSAATPFVRTTEPANAVPSSVATISPAPSISTTPDDDAKPSEPISKRAASASPPVASVTVPAPPVSPKPLARRMAPPDTAMVES